METDAIVRDITATRGDIRVSITEWRTTDDVLAVGVSIYLGDTVLLSDGFADVPFSPEVLERLLDGTEETIRQSFYNMNAREVIECW